MSVDDEIEQKLHEIGVAAAECFQKREIEYHGLDLDENGRVVIKQYGDGEPVTTSQWPVTEGQRRKDNLDTVLSELRTKLRTFYGVDPGVLSVISTDLGDLASANSNPHTVYARVRSAAEWVRQVDDKLIHADGEKSDDWTGDAARTFDTQFLQPFNNAATAQMEYARELRIVAAAFYNTVTKAHDDLKTIADNTIKALRSPGSVDDALNTIGILAGVFGFVPGPVGIVANVVGLTASIAQAARNERKDPQKFTIEGGTAEKIITSACHAVKELDKLLTYEDDHIFQALNKDLGAESFGDQSITLDRPSLADEENPTFGAVTDAKVAATVVDLYRAGYYDLPTAAYEYQSAAQYLGNIATPYNTGRYLPRCVTKFEVSCDHLSAALKKVEDSLTDAGEKLVKIAQSYELTDQQRAEATSAINDIPPPKQQDVQEAPGAHHDYR